MPPPTLDVPALRRDFPALALSVHGRPLAYLDSASTTQKPQVVLDALQDAYVHRCANVHRGVHALSVAATEAFEGARARVARFLGGRPDEVVFTRGTTEALNLVAETWGRTHVGPGDRVLVSGLEHHANLVPWFRLCRAVGAHLDVLPIDAAGAVQVDLLSARLTPRTRLLAISHVSNALGTVAPVAELARRARAVGAVTVVDGAQAAPHLELDVGKLGCDFYAFSGHKVYGPTGIGALWGRAELLEAMPPWQGGGEMIARVSFDEITYADPPHRFEAGTPDIFGAIALGAALDYLAGLERGAVARHEAALLALAEARLAALPGVRVVGAAPERVAVLSFVVAGLHPHDVGTILDLEGVAVRTGLHCAEPAMDALGLEGGTVRASFAVYNTAEEVERLVQGVLRAQEVLTR